MQPGCLKFAKTTHGENNMKVIILSAGQGKRLLPLTADTPKCLLNIQGKTLLEWQIGELHKCGIENITVVSGYGSEKVDALLQENYGQQNIHTHYNPDFATTDNLVSCWKVRDEMSEDFILLNGDTLFEAAVVRSLLASPENPITVTINHKDIYDTDDMKVSLAETRLTKVSKDIPQSDIHGESIGMILFRGEGPMIFRKGLENALNDTKSVHKWYLSVIDAIAQEKRVLTCSISGLLWCEVDYPADLKKANKIVTSYPAESKPDTVTNDPDRQITTA
jgi:L-glutamine-phosphate cytidylyltransferase